MLRINTVETVFNFKQTEAVFDFSPTVNSVIDNFVSCFHVPSNVKVSRYRPPISEQATLGGIIGNKKHAHSLAYI